MNTNGGLSSASTVQRPPYKAKASRAIKAIAIGAALLIAIFVASVAIQMGSKAVAVFTALTLAPTIFLASSRTIVYGIVIISFVVSGSLYYFAGISLANWVPYLLCLALGLRVVASRATTTDFLAQVHGSPAFLRLLLAFFVLVAASALINHTPIGFDFLALKHFFVMWIPTFFIWKDKGFEAEWIGLWKLLLGIAVIQLPVALLQRFRHFGHQDAASLNWDSIVGTFGGTPDGTGLSGAMALFLIFATLLAGSLWRNHQLGGRTFTVVTLAAIFVIGIAEVRAGLVLLPLAFFFLFRDMIGKRPAMFMAGAILAMTVLLIMLYAYYRTYVGKDGIDRGFVDTVLPKFTQFFDPSFVNRFTGEVGRIPALFLWWAGNSTDPVSLAFGHGPMAVRVSSVFGVGDIIRTSPFNLGSFSLPVFLWELGTIATCLFLLSLAMAVRTAFRLSTRHDIPACHRAALTAGSFGMFMIMIFMPYNRDMIDSVAIQNLLALLFAHTAYWWGQTRSISTARFHRPSQP